jgi:hypothetical protein
MALQVRVRTLRKQQMACPAPRDFSYVTFSKTGEAFGSGLLVPRNHDGMTCATWGPWERGPL